MKVLVLGASGHIGARLLEMLQATPWAKATGASRHMKNTASWLELDSRDPAQLAQALKGFDAVVNCVAGDAASIAGGARALVQAALQAECPRIVHLSTMSVYGPAEGNVREDAPLDPTLGWYGRAKCEAEEAMHDFVRHGGEAVMLRPGCVYGPGSQLWVGRIGRWLQAGRLGDLGIAGDGWANLVHVDDVCQALMQALRLPTAPGKIPVFNLAAPDSPRWNDYFVDLALAIKATPVRRLGRRRLKLDAWLLGPPLKIAERALKRLGNHDIKLPDALPPGLLGLWSQHIHLDTHAASGRLGVQWTPYAEGLRDSASWFCAPASASQPTLEDKMICTP
jgi:nucleoside-diphosphate-sugar epimerase